LADSAGAQPDHTAAVQTAAADIKKRDDLMNPPSISQWKTAATARPLPGVNIGKEATPRQPRPAHRLAHQGDHPQVGGPDALGSEAQMSLRGSFNPAFGLCLALGACAGADTASDPSGGDVNPFYVESTLPLGMPHFDQIRNEHFLPAFERGMEEHMARVLEIANDPCSGLPGRRKAPRH
jgi:hypothetical protein